MREGVDIHGLLSRLATVADEAFGPFPVQSAGESLSEIERGIRALRAENERLRAELAARMAGHDNLCDEMANKLAEENERLRGCLDKANAHHEEFERKWYLATDEVERLRADLAARDAEGSHALAQRLLDRIRYEKGQDERPRDRLAEYQRMRSGIAEVVGLAARSHNPALCDAVHCVACALIDFAKDAGL